MIPANKPLKLHDMIVFQRLLRFLPSLNILSALTAGASTSLIQMPEFHPSSTPLAHAAEGFLVISASLGVISIMLAVMLLFRFEGHDTATRLEYMIVWSPLVLMDHAIVAFLVGLMVWYADQNKGWRSMFMGGTVGVLLVYTASIAVGMYKSMHREGGLGQEEIAKMAEARRMASSVNSSITT